MNKVENLYLGWFPKVEEEHRLTTTKEAAVPSSDNDLFLKLTRSEMSSFRDENRKYSVIGAAQPRFSTRQRTAPYFIYVK